MTGESSDSSSPQQQPNTSVLITIRTPGEDAPICRLGNSEEILGDATVRQLIQRVINPNSLFAVGVPASQLQAESSAALAIGEMLSADCCEVRSGAGGEESGELVGLDEPIRAVAQEQIGSQGNRFLNVTLNVRSAADTQAPESEERRELSLPAAVEVEQHDAESPAGLEQAVAFDLGAGPSETPSEEPVGGPAATAVEDAKPEPMHAGLPPAVQPGDASPLPLPEPVDAGPTPVQPGDASPLPVTEPVEAGLTPVLEPVDAGPSPVPEPVEAAPSTAAESIQRE